MLKPKPLGGVGAPSFLGRLRKSRVMKSLVMAVTLWMTLFPGWLAVGSWSDTDSDSLNDTWTDPGTMVATSLADMNLVSLDADNDGATNAEEAAAGTDPYSYDTDHDDIRDGDELHITATNPLSWDSDGDEYSDYPKYERDRFVIRVPTVLFPNTDSITIKLATKRPQGTADQEDAPTNLECVKNGGYFESKPMILVADEADDTWGTISPEDEQLDDPTHIASPGGKVEMELPLAGNPKVQVSVAPSSKKIVVECYVVRSPSTQLPPLLGDQIERQFERSVEVYKQTHVEVVQRGPYECMIEDSVMQGILTNSGDGDNNLAIQGSLMHPLNSEAKTVFDRVLQDSGTGTDVVRVVLFPCDSLDGLLNRLAVTLKSANGTWEGYEGFIVIPYHSAGYWRALAHEIGHAISLDHPLNAAVGNYALMYRADDTESYGAANDEYLIKRFLKEDLQRLSASPSPQFLKSK